MQQHLATQSSSYTKHGGDVYSTCLPNALQHGDRTETGPACGSNLVRQPSKGWATATQHICAILSFPGDGDKQTTGISTNETHYTSALRMRTHTPVLLRQCNDTDCGIFTLLYQQTVSNWYGTAAGQTFTNA